MQRNDEHIETIDRARIKVREKLSTASYRTNLLMDELHGKNLRPSEDTSERLCWSYVNDLYEDVDKLINALDVFKASLDDLYDDLEGEYDTNPDVWEAPRLYK